MLVFTHMTLEFKEIPPIIPKVFLEQPDEERREDTPQAVESRERTLLQNLRERTRTWAMASSLVLVTSIVGMMEHFSHATHQETKAHAANIIKDLEPRAPHTEITQNRREPAQSEQEESAQEEARYQSYRKKIQDDPASFVLWIEELKHEPFGMKLAHEALNNDPFLFVGFWEHVQQAFPNTSPLIETVLKADPGVLLVTDGKTLDLFHKTIAESEDPRIKLIDQIARLDLTEEEKEKLLALSPLISTGRFTIEEAQAVSADKEKYLATLLELVATESDFARVTIQEELHDFFVKDIFKMNELHNATPEKRFESIKSYGPRELYTLLAVDRLGTKDDEDPLAYPSTYQGVFNRLLERMDKKDQSGQELLSEMGSYRFDAFVSLAVQRGRFEDFLKTMEPDDQKRLVESLVNQIVSDIEPETRTGIVADIVQQMEDPELYAVMEEAIKNQYLKAKEGSELQTAFGVLSLMAEPNATWVPQEKRAGFKLPDQSSLETKELESSDGVIVERYFFYNDEDGGTSFVNFLKRYKGKPEWKIEQKPGYVIVSSKGQDRAVKIYANEPSTGPDLNNQDRLDPVDQLFEAEGIEPTVVVHRGHIYHQEQTIERMPHSTKLLVLGSCGGYATVAQIMSKHPEVQVISTRGTGTKAINDRLLSSLDTSLRDQETIEWKDFWSGMSQRLERDEDFRDYVPPNEHFYPLVKSHIKATQTDV